MHPNADPAFIFLDVVGKQEGGSLSQAYEQRCIIQILQRLVMIFYFMSGISLVLIALFHVFFRMLLISHLCSYSIHNLIVG